MNWGDYVVIGLVALFALVGMVKGFIMSVYRLLAFVACIYASVRFSPVLADYLKKTPLYEWINNAITANLSKLGQEAAASVSAGADSAAGIEKLVGTIPLPEFLRKFMLENLPSAGEIIGLDGIMKAVGGEMAGIVVSIISLAAIFIVLQVIFSIAGILLRGISKLPVFRQVDRLGGLILGALQGIMAVYALFALLFLFSTNPAFAGIFNELESSLFAKSFYENNLIINWLFPASAAAV